ncbi:MAG: hypothetical protein DID92_2727744267 [Candidatus Nitrotoga sp. SPKER]|nr:MAG: hypothetical protein DID92_2727744267 [Candidatus Nitrotoga sp. SPKER]
MYWIAHSKSIASAKTIKQLQQAQAVVLPLRYGMSLEQAAQPIRIVQRLDMSIA